MGRLSWLRATILYFPALVTIGLGGYSHYKSLGRPRLIQGLFSILCLCAALTLTFTRDGLESAVRRGIPAEVRMLPDSAQPFANFTAHQALKEYDFKEELSLIIVVRDEAEFIGKTVEYVLETTPDRILREMIIVDDASAAPVSAYLTPSWFDSRLHRHRHSLDKIRILRFDSKQGLIRAKIAGAELSISPNIFFLDGHCRPEQNWYQPLLDKVNPAIAKPTPVRDRTTEMEVPIYKRIVTPQIFDIDRFTWKDKGTFGLKMMFDWTFEFDWFEDFTDQVPILPGGIELITRKWWEESGMYDSGMLEWGGENIEQSLRTWMCGGEIVETSKSRIGHIFDRPPKPNPGNALVKQVQRNQKRAAIVWLDDYYQYMERYHPVLKSLDPGSGLEYRQYIRERLGCRPFSWFVNKFKSAFERRGLLIHEYRRIQNRDSNLCLEGQKNGGVKLAPCKRTSAEQMWSNVFGGRMLHNLGINQCLTRKASQVRLEQCKWTNMLKNHAPDQLFQYDNGSIATSLNIDTSSKDGNDWLAAEVRDECVNESFTITACGISMWNLLW